MTTADKRKKFEKEYPSVLRDVMNEIDNDNCRYVDYLCNDKKICADGKIRDYLPKYAKEYCITLLCDKIIQLTNNN